MPMATRESPAQRPADQRSRTNAIVMVEVRRRGAGHRACAPVGKQRSSVPRSRVQALILTAPTRTTAPVARETYPCFQRRLRRGYSPSEDGPSGPVSRGGVDALRFGGLAESSQQDLFQLEASTRRRASTNINEQTTRTTAAFPEASITLPSRPKCGPSSRPHRLDSSIAAIFQEFRQSVEPAGIEPATSCLQSNLAGLRAVTVGSESPVNTGFSPIMPPLGYP